MLQPDDVKTDHYAALGVSKETDLTKIRGAYRKLALNLHPDKIKDESQRESAREEWHRVQKAYEILSDDKDRSAYDNGRAKFLDKEAKLAELKRELREHRRTDSSYASPRGSGSASAREMRNGHIVEERVPMESYFDEAMRFTDEPNPMGRKNDDFGRRTKPKPTDDRKKARVPTSSQRAAKDLRESTKASNADRAKKLDRERRRDVSAKYEEKFDSYSPRIVDSESEYESSGPEIYLRTREPSSSRRTRESIPRESRSRPTRPAPRRRDTYYEDEDYSEDAWQSKVYGAQEHIQRSKHEQDARPRSSRSPPRRRGYDSGEPETSASRRAARSSRSTRDRERSSSRNNSYDKLDSRSGDYFKPPKMPSATTSPNVKSSMRPSLFTRATTATATAFTRPKRESSSRNDSSLDQMVREQVPPSRSSKLRNNDSGYSSSSTPEMPQHSHSPKVTARYTIDPETITIEPSKSKYRMASPDRDRPTRTMPPRANTFAEPSRIEIRSVKPSVKPSRTYTDVEYTRPVGRSDIKYAKDIRPGDASYSPSRSQKIPSSYYNERHPPPSRRQSTAA